MTALKIKRNYKYLIFLFSFSCIYLYAQVYLSKTIRHNYQSLLNLFPMYSQGRDFLEKDTELSLQPMTYGLLLSGESLSFSKYYSAEDKIRSEKAVSWLLKKFKYQKEKGYRGWGLPQAWDAFGDGSVNPPDHPYSITTAIVLQGLLDYLMVFPDHAFNSEIEKVLKETVTYWCNNLFFDIDGETGFFSYSPFSGDRYFCPNVSSMVCGVFQRVIHDYGHLFSSKELVKIQGVIDKAVKGIIENVIYLDGLPFWQYVVYENKESNTRTNANEVHHGLILWGVGEYRRYSGQVNIPWSSEHEILSLDLFWENNGLKNVHILQQNKLPAKLWGVGMAMAVYSRQGNIKSATRCLDLLIKNYGLPNMSIYPLNYTKRRGLPNSRHNSYVLFGIGHLIKSSFE